MLPWCHLVGRALSKFGDHVAVWLLRQFHALRNASQCSCTAIYCSRKKSRPQPLFQCRIKCVCTRTRRLEEDGLCVKSCGVSSRLTVSCALESGGRTLDITCQLLTGCELSSVVSAQLPKPEALQDPAAQRTHCPQTLAKRHKPLLSSTSFNLHGRCDHTAQA